MHTMSVPRTKKAGSFGRRPAGTTEQTRSYTLAQPSSSRICTADGIPLGTLLLKLQSAKLARPMRNWAWGLVEKLATQYVTAKHGSTP